jgi:ribosome-associated protein
MPRKFNKGYYVRGHFVAEGSELDLELKRELKGDTDVSRTDMKKQSDELQLLGEQLLTLRADLMARVDLPDKLIEAVADAKRITNFEGRRRQMQFIGKLMRKLDAATVQAVQDALEEQRKPSAKETQRLHQAEDWRDRMIADDQALTAWLALDSQSDAQHLRALIRQARKDAQAPGAKELPGQAPRHGKAYRELFQTVKTALSREDDSPAIDTEEDGA